MSKKPTDAPKPDSSYEEDDGGFLFTAWNIHVKANSLKEAKAHVLEYHGKDVDKDIPPPLAVIN